MHNELIQVNYDNDRITTSARTLWEGLNKPYDQFTKWFDKYKEYGFIENEDYLLVSTKILTNNPKNPYATAQDYEITLDMAKQLAMLQKTPEGKIYRDYFIKLEKKWNSPEFVMERALKMARQKCEELEEKFNEAIRTKAYISDKKTATALGKVGGLTKVNNHLREENSELKEELGKCKEYATILAVQRFTSGNYKWKALKDYCTAHELEIKEASDQRYGTVKSYPAEAWLSVYNIDLDLLF